MTNRDSPWQASRADGVVYNIENQDLALLRERARETVSSEMKDDTIAVSKIGNAGKK
jgi:hypothetical protein